MHLRAFGLVPFAVALLATEVLRASALTAYAPLLAVDVAHPLAEHIAIWDEYSGR